MKKVLLILIGLLLLSGCGQATEKQEAVYMNITAQEAKALMDTEENYVILDVRTQEEFDQKKKELLNL